MAWDAAAAPLAAAEFRSDPGEIKEKKIMTENMKKFLEKVSGNRDLAEELSRSEKDAMVAEAKKMGIELTDADFAPEENALSDDELEAVAGGKACMCIIGGAGKKDDRAHGDDVCRCIGGGAGETQDGLGRCSCAIGGGGISK